MQSWYFYSTYLASRLAGMAHQPAQEIAYLCQSLHEMVPGKELAKCWFWQEQCFTPCVSGIGDSTTAMPKDQARQNSEILFRCLPDLGSNTNDKASTKTLTRLFSGAYEKVQTWFNPLTDIDWLQHGRFRSKLQQRLDHQSQQPALQVTDETSQKKASISCRPNSDTSILLLRDAFSWCYQNKQQPIAIQALLACCLYTFQNTWLQPKTDRYSSDARTREQAFLALFYAVKCYLTRTPVKTQRAIADHIEVNKLMPLPGGLLKLFAEDFEYLGAEQDYIQVILHTLDFFQCAPFSVQEVLVNGLRYRENFLLDELRQTVLSTSNREILDIRAFKDSRFFRLNQAMAWQGQWLDKRFAEMGIENMPIAQSVGDQKIWQ